MWYLIALCFFLAPALLGVAVFFVALVTFVDVLANDEVVLALGVVAFGLGGAGVCGAAAATGFFVASAF